LTVEKNHSVEAQKTIPSGCLLFSTQVELCIARASQPSLRFASPFLAANQFTASSHLIDEQQD
jgi:hypothetical protein